MNAYVSVEQMNKAKRLAAKGKSGLNAAALYLAVIIISRKVWQMIKIPVWRTVSVVGTGVIFCTTTSFAPISYSVPESIVEYAESIPVESEMDSAEYIETEPEAEEDMASLDDLIAGREDSADDDIGELEAIESENAKLFDKNDWNLILINKEHPISDSYSFTLGTIKGNMKCDERILTPLTDMFTAAANDGINLVVCSPFRDISRQEYLFDRKMKNYMNSGYSYIDAYKEASAVVTVPGASEHQIGIALDIVCDSYSQLNDGFGETAAGKWLMDNSYKYGFILRYPQNKEEITGIIYEPWHYRYVGVEAATIIHDEGICLEEFIGSL